MTSIIIGGNEISPTNPLAVSAGGVAVAPSASYTRPADTTAYAAGDAVANSTSAPTVLTFSSAVRANGGSGIIIGAQLIDNSSPTTPGQFELYLFSATVTPTNDNAALDISAADALKLVGVIPFTTNKKFTSSTVYSAMAMGDCAPFGFVADAGGTSLFGLLCARNAYSPKSGGVLTLKLTIAGN